MEPVTRENVSSIRSDLGEGQVTAFAVIDSRKLDRECFVRVIRATHSKISLTAYNSVQEWKETPHGAEPCVVLLNIGGRRATEGSVAEDLESLVAEADGTPVIVLAESEDLRDMIAAVEKSGLKVDEFNHIVETMTANADVRERVAAKLQERQGGG